MVPTIKYLNATQRSVLLALARGEPDAVALRDLRRVVLEVDRDLPAVVVPRMSRGRSNAKGT